MQNSGTVISVIVPVYNVEKYLEGCLRSLLCQTFRDFELICVDDGSPDSSGKILEEWKKKVKDIPFTVIHTENRGLSAARNLGLTYAKGKYISFVDSDDSVTPDYLQIMYEEMIRSNADLVACGRKMVPAIRQWEKTSSPVIKRFEGDIFGRYYRKEFRLGVEAVGALYRKELLPSFPYLPGIYYEDYCFFHTKYFLPLNRISLVENDLYLITRSEHSIMRSSYNEKKLSSFFVILEEIHANIENFPAPYRALLYRRTHNNMIHRALRELLLMEEGGEKDRLVQMFQHLFLSLLRKGVLKRRYLRWKYVILALFLSEKGNGKIFRFMARILL